MGPEVRFDRSSAEDLLARACEAVALDASGAELIRLGTAAVFRLHAAPVIVRIGRNGSGARVAEQEVRVARWLCREGVPASRALGVDQPVVVDGHVATMWESASEREQYGSTTDLARLLRRLHELAPPGDPKLPGLDPFAKATERITRSRALTDADRRYLHSRQQDLVHAYGELPFVLEPGVIHGDASVGNVNVILDRDGEPLLIDLDGVAVGPREWDLILTAIYFDRYGWHTPEEYAAFVDVMGFDVTTWPGYQVLGDVREFLMVTWLAETASDGTKVAELSKRVSALRAGGGRRDWSPF